MQTNETEDSPLDSFEINTYTVTVPVRLSEFDSYDEIELAIVEVTARSIADDVDHLDESDASYVATKVDLNSAELEAVFDEGVDDVVSVETNTQLGLAPEV
ncbi:hypothetical protein [Natrialba asiatica]|uniref:Uncharacterized protein n=1 Tax=Natrialba asiatica (strain ATCC 700177 / DSM 12278 / JCM 9576 / FERM P-10747 / NBRC 102637 / 172P1) TaxID=29540 RepID=M0AQF2_NATA1|nr:hypothetical protein [Natrialba asiatica]ELZ00780.1 hypothetical protein C481_11115 [Natrialba asiatica DSM 12278]